MPLLSLCLIAKDEEAFLGACLESVREAADELIVVDTGSRDATLDIARSHGARVVEHRWQEDFAAARNAALAEASGDYVLQLDADEQLAPGSAGALRRACEEGGLRCGLLRLHNASVLSADPADVVSGKHRQGPAAWLPRLFAREGDLAYRGRVHESIEHWIVSRPEAPTRLEADIVHYGFVPEVRERKQKSARNLALLRRRLEEAPGDVLASGYLGLELVEAGLRDEAHRVVEGEWARLEELPLGQSVLRLSAARSLLRLSAGDGQGLLETVERARRFDPDHPDLDFLEGRALELIAAKAEATERPALLGRAAGLFRRATQPRPSGQWLEGASVRACRVRAASAFLASKQPREALVEAGLLLAELPEDVEGKLLRAEALLDAGEPSAALGELLSFAQAHPDVADGWALAAAAAGRLGASADARLFAQQARAPGKRFLVEGRSQRLS